MNKKFSTLMAGLMLASAFSVASAQEASGKYENGKYYVLAAKGSTGNASYISVVSEPGEQYGKLYLEDEIEGLTKTRNSLWKVSVTKETVGDAPKYSFVNVATGQTLSVPTPEKGKSLPNVAVDGRFMEWHNGLSSTAINTTDGELFMSYVGTDDVVYLKAGTTDDVKTGEGADEITWGTSVTVERKTVDDADDGLKVYPAIAEVVNLGAEELNKELIMNNKEDVFTLSFDRDVTEGAENLFTGVNLVAEKLYVADGTTDDKDADLLTAAEKDAAVAADKDAKYNLSQYVRVKVYDTKNYLVVDTALHKGSEADKQLPKFAYDDPNKEVVDGNNILRLPGSFNFKFAYDPTENRVLIKVQQYVKKIPYSRPAIVSGAANTGDGNTAYTYWPYASSYTYYDNEGTKHTDGNATTKDIVKDAYVRLVELSNVRELTVAYDTETSTDPYYKNENEAYKEWEGADDLTIGMLTNVTIGESVMAYEPTTIPTGLYLIQYVKGDEQDATANDFFVANLGGAFGYAEQAKNQDYDHMPAAQWYVKQNGTISSARISITNREFFDQTDYVSNGDTKTNVLGLSSDYQAFKAEDGNYFFTSGAFNGETLKFIPVSAESKADSLLGYKHADEKQASVETYVFNYLHGLALDKGLNTPSDKDSLVRVDETGAKAAFRLVPVVEHDSYGMQLSANDVKATGISNLLRNAYYIKAYDNSKFEGERYLTYDEASKKYVMTFVPTAYFLKENNCIDGTHYYALVKANFYSKAYAEGDKSNWETSYLQGKLKDMYPAQFVNKNKVKDEAEVWSFYELTQEEKTLSDGSKIANPLTKKQQSEVEIIFYDKNGEPIVADASSDVALYAYMPNDKNVITLQRLSHKNDATGGTDYFAMNPKGTHVSILKIAESKPVLLEGEKLERVTTNYATKRVSVDDNTLDLTLANISDKWEQEIRVSAFEVAINDSPLYRRFNGAAPETYGTAANAPLNLKFFRFNNNGEYLFENQSNDNAYRDGIADKSISFLGVNNAYQYPESETRSYTIYVDTAYVRNNTRMPQYLLAIRPEIIPGDTTWCNATSAHHHETLADSLACDHTVITAGFTRAMYLFNAQDSIDAKNYDYQGKAAYGAKDYTRLAFKDAVHAGDTLYILKPNVTTDQLKATDLKDGDLFVEKIFLGNNKHKNVVFQFRLIDSDNNRFLIESEAEQNGAAVLNKDLQNVSIAPMRGGWVKVQNGVPVIARYQDFNEAIAQADVFDVNDEITYDATANDEVAVESVKVIAGNGQVTIMGAAGKNVTITTVLGKTVVAKTIASDNETIAVPTTGIVAVAVEGEEAVMTIVK